MEALLIPTHLLADLTPPQLAGTHRWNRQHERSAVAVVTVPGVILGPLAQDYPDWRFLCSSMETGSGLGKRGVNAVKNILKKASRRSDTRP